jgi:hypothetical protein
MLPHDLPPWETVYSQFRAWKRQGAWEEVHRTLREFVRIGMGREPHPSALIIDSQSVKTTEKGGLAATTRARKLKAGRGLGFRGWRVPGKACAVDSGHGWVEDRDCPKDQWETSRLGAARSGTSGRPNRIPGASSPLGGGTDLRVDWPLSALQQGL